MVRLLASRKEDNLLEYLIKDHSFNRSEEAKNEFLDRLKDSLGRDVLSIKDYENGFSLIHANKNVYGNFLLDSKFQPHIAKLSVFSPDFGKKDKMYGTNIGNYIFNKVNTFIELYSAIHEGNFS